MKFDKNQHIAYLSMEIALNEDMPTYSGGLGVLAGDNLRSCADLELPVVGVTLLYRKGFFKQVLDKDGNQIEKEISWNPTEFLEETIEKVSVTIENRTVYIKPWVYRMKGVTGFENPVILLDTCLDENSEYDKTITDKLYANDEYYRLAQEIVLGMGGVKALSKLGYNQIQKYHMNEGHSALLALELSKDSSIEEIREKCVFTTHTPVAAGHDTFPKELAVKMLGEKLQKGMFKGLLDDGKLNMTHLGLEFSGHINGVAKKHGEVSREMFPGYDIEAITNGVHSGFWTSEPFMKLYDRYLKGWQYDPFCLRYVLTIPQEDIWLAHKTAKDNLISYINDSYDAQFDPNVFTIGFARRATSYKRPDFIFSDMERLKKIAKNSKGLQIIFGGKAHPNDHEGKSTIKKIFECIEQVKEHVKVCYVEDYDMETAKMLVSGVDLWLNTPSKPMEASGTSGMKAAHNGVPQFSILDGWWLEGHIENFTGWSIGVHPDKQERDVDEVEDMYAKLEYVILPMFYNNRSSWIDIMRHSIAINASFFNTHRMVQQYVLNAYFT
ncbi:MAG: alpha-glucan family phosphorylase [Candidatus Nanoarchaeia archaeon]